MIAGAGSVFDTHAAHEWLRLLEALERPGATRRAHAVALTCFFGWSAERCALAEDADWERLHDTLHDWAQVLRTRGVASLMETVTREQDLSARVLGELGGERALTDIRHIAQLLHGAALADSLGPTALAQWLRRRITEAERDSADEDRSRRLESDARAVQVLTVHRAKGLEFGIVYLPYQWDFTAGDRRPGPVVFHDDDNQRTLDVSLEGPEYQAHRLKQQQEQRGEELRLLYVALTRAKHQVVLWWAASFPSRDSALARLLFARDGTTIPDQMDAPPDDKTATEVFRALIARSEEAITLERARRLVPPAAWPGEPSTEGELAAARFGRDIDITWRRTSYSALTAAAHEAAPVGSEPEAAGVQDEPEGGAAPPGAWADVPVGVRTGTLVHRALEAVDFSDPEFGADILELGAEAGLRAALATPLGDPFGIRLADLARADRLDELEFELPLGGGTVAGLAEAAASAHGDPYGDRLAGLEADELQGFLTGSLDLVARLAGRPLRDLRLQDQRAGGLRPGRAARGDAPPPLRPAGAALRRRPAPLPALARARRGDRGRRLPVPARDGRHAGRRRVRVDPPDPTLVEELSVPSPDAFSRRRALGATGLLADFNAAGVISAADVHVARRLCDAAGRDRRRRPARHGARGTRVRASATCTSTSPRSATRPPPMTRSRRPLGAPVARRRLDGQVAISRMVSDGPLVLEGSALYLDRYWREENAVAADLRALNEQLDAERRCSSDGLGRLFDDAVAGERGQVALTRRLAVVAGGPGTGKTTTVARILALLFEQRDRPARGAGRADRQGAGAAAGGDHRRGGGTSTSPRRSASRSSGCAAPPCTACSAGGPTAAAASATTAASGCRTTS